MTDRRVLKNYYYTGDDGLQYCFRTSQHLGEAGGLKEIPPDRFHDLNHRQISRGMNPRYVWVKEVVPSSPGTTKKYKLVVEPDSELFRTTEPHLVKVDGVDFVSTGRAGETRTWGASPHAIEVLLEARVVAK